VSFLSLRSIRPLFIFACSSGIGLVPGFFRSKKFPLAGTPEASLGPRRPSSRFAGDWICGLFLIGSVILTYLPVWQAGFIWDDDAVLTANPCIVGPLGIKEIWTTSAADICPLVLTTFGIEHALWGLEPLPFHLVNVLMHAAGAVLLWRVLRSLRVPGAWLGAALWALHPVGVESVAWITEMKNTESALFFLLSILYFVKWLAAKELNGRTENFCNYALTLIFAALAMASKSSTVILPVVLCLCAWWIEGRWRWRNAARVVPVFLLSIASSVLSIWTQGLQLATLTDPQWARHWPERLAAAGDAIWFYLGKLLWPHPLITIYPRWHIEAGQWISFLPMLAVIVLLFILWLRRRLGCRACFFAFAYFVTALLPVLGLIDNPIFRYSLVFDHFQYLASIGPLALLGTGLARSADFIIPKKPWFHSALCAELLLLLAVVSWQRTRVYANQETLWTETLAQNPRSWLAQNTVGLIFFARGQWDEAVAQFQNVLEIYPNFADAHCNLGSALFQRGQPDEGVAQFQKALEINPYLAEAHSNLGSVFLGKGQLDDAVAQFKEVLKITPNSFSTHYSLGDALFRKGQLEEAISQFQEALRLKPDFRSAEDGLAKVQALVRHKAVH
jgi:tetratricopeptide (TPR) repeat protein